MSSSFKVQNNFKNILAQTERAANESLLETGTEILEEIRSIAPRKSGELAESYEMLITGENAIEIGSPLERALPAEFGTSRPPASPHVMPAVANSGERIGKKLAGKMK
jgi:hypothetical protein